MADRGVVRAKLFRERTLSDVDLMDTGFQGRPKLGGNDASCVMDILGGKRKNSVTFYTVL